MKITIEVTGDCGHVLETFQWDGIAQPNLIPGDATRVTPENLLRYLATQANPRAVLYAAAGRIAAERGLTLGPANDITIETSGDALIEPVAILETK